MQQHRPHLDDAHRSLWDVLVVGAGPVGQTLAILLGQAGHRVLNVDRWPEPYPLPRAVRCDDEAARVLQAADVADRLGEATEPVDRFVLRGVDGASLELLEHPQGPAGWPAYSAVHQPDLETLLAKRLAELTNVTQRRCWELTGLEQYDSHVVVAGDSSGVPEVERARWVVGADGAGSLVRSTMETTVTDLGMSEDLLVVDVVLHHERTWDPPALHSCDDGRPVTALPAGPGRRRWEFGVLPDEDPASLDRDEVAWELLAPWGVTPENAQLERRAVYRFDTRWADTWRDRRVLLAGDAAHLLPPFPGSGLSEGLRDAAALAWRLDGVLRGRYEPLALDSYGWERLARVRACIESSASLGMEPNAVAGGAAPQGRVQCGARQGLFDDVVGRGLLLLTIAESTSPPPDIAIRLSSLGGRVVRIVEPIHPLACLGEDVVVDLDGTYHRWLGGAGASAALVRPDFVVVGTAGDRDGVERLVRVLVRQLAPLRRTRHVQGRVEALGYREGLSGRFLGDLAGLYESYHLGEAGGAAATFDLDLPLGRMTLVVRQTPSRALPRRPEINPFASGADLLGVLRRRSLTSRGSRAGRADGPTMKVRLAIDPERSSGAYAGATGTTCVEVPNHLSPGSLVVHTDAGPLWLDCVEETGRGWLDAELTVDGAHSGGAWHEATGTLRFQLALRQLDLPEGPRTCATGSYEGEITSIVDQ